MKAGNLVIQSTHKKIISPIIISATERVLLYGALKAGIPRKAAASRLDLIRADAMRRLPAGSLRYPERAPLLMFGADTQKRHAVQCFDKGHPSSKVLVCGFRFQRLPKIGIFQDLYAGVVYVFQ